MTRLHRIGGIVVRGMGASSMLSPPRGRTARAKRELEFYLFTLLVLGLFVLAGCGATTSTPTLGKWEGPSTLTPVKISDWTYGEQKARRLESPHYHIYTTIEEEDVLDLLPQIMEGAYTMYRQIAPDVPLSDRPMDCFMFHWRSEWDRYTQRYTGQDSKVYLQIRSGGYCIRDRYVAYYFGRTGTFSVSAHEGWHQFAGRHFKGRLPPFFEEGVACLFETISWNGRLPQWNLSINTNRAQTLRKVMDANTILPLEKLCAMHAGDVVGEEGQTIDGFYAQCWAFARFMYDGDGGKYRPAMQKWLAETAAGTVFDPTGTHRHALSGWNRNGVRPMLEHYLGMNIRQIDERYREYMKKVAYEELSGHWRS